ncbi:serine O-acetyltransferase [Brevundimonas sp. 2R-24]|uniref:Serine acetyltransferase n=1 Tax=Peiella sedimenti TaxID=3061083 RepID=A0ABT8SI22_9CAUL|nr:serine O-acetyltransferase [Caulobacteraceae bacterium XZ-24]
MSHRLELVERADPVWDRLRREAVAAAQSEPRLASMLHSVILSHRDLSGALSFQLARKLSDEELGPMALREICDAAYKDRPEIVASAARDLEAVVARDPATDGVLQPFLYFKGYLALQAHRVAHLLWSQGRATLAYHFQSRVSELFQVDIHPAARIGSGVMLDHGTGIVIGETAQVGDDVSMLHGVTLGGTGAKGGDRHPKIGKGVLLGAGAKVLGNIRIGDHAKIASGSVVLKPVPDGCTAAGVPARLVNCPAGDAPALTMDHTLDERAYDFVI